MKIYLASITAGRYHGGADGAMENIIKFIEQVLIRENFKSSFDEFWLTLSYPPDNVKSGIMTKEFQKYYDDLPYSRISRKRKEINVTLKAPEFAEYFNEEDKSRFAHEFEVILAKKLIDKFIEAEEVIRPKLKKEDVFDQDLFTKNLMKINESITSDFLSSIVPIRGLL